MITQEQVKHKATGSWVTEGEGTDEDGSCP